MPIGTEVVEGGGSKDCGVNDALGKIARQVLPNKI